MGLHGAQPSGREHPLERWATSVAALALGLVCVFIVLTIVSRWLGRVLIPDDIQIVRQMMIAVIVLPLASVTALRMHIEVTVFTDRLAGAGMRGLIRFGNAIGLIVVGILLWGGVLMLVGSWGTREYYEGDLRIPHWLGHATYVVALATAFVRFAVASIGAAPDPAVQDR